MNRSEAASEDRNLLARLLKRSDISATYWIPAKDRGERGLLETLYRRTTDNSTYLLLSTRPPAELQKNFSLPNGLCIDLDTDMFKHSKTALAVRSVELLHDGVAVRGSDLKKGLREHLPQLHRDDYYLVRYRDYSDWAVTHYGNQAVRDALFAPKYVEQCFAVKVGQNPGVLIPITEPQLLFGEELLLRQAATSIDREAKYSLNSDQFQALLSVGDGTPELAQKTPKYERQRCDNDRKGDDIPWWDWRPSSIQLRVHRYLDEQYRWLGRVVARILFLVLTVYISVYVLRHSSVGFRLLPSLSSSSPPPQLSRRQARALARQQGPADTVGSIISSAISAPLGFIFGSSR
jgi:hypothetical protein